MYRIKSVRDWWKFHESSHGMQHTRIVACDDHQCFVRIHSLQRDACTPSYRVSSIPILCDDGQIWIRWRELLDILLSYSISTNTLTGKTSREMWTNLRQFPKSLEWTVDEIACVQERVAGGHFHHNQKWRQHVITAHAFVIKVLKAWRHQGPQGMKAWKL